MIEGREGETETTIAEISSQVEAAATDPVWRQVVASGEELTHSIGMEIATRLTSVENALQRVEPMLSRIDERLHHVATKEDVIKLDERMKHSATREDLTSLAGGLRTQINKLDGKLDKVAEAVAAKPGKGFVITTIIAMLGLVIAVLAVAPYLRHPVGN